MLHSTADQDAHQKIAPSSSSSPFSLPLIYTTQHDGIGAAVSPTQNVRYMLEYLTCRRSSGIDGDSRYRNGDARRVEVDFSPHNRVDFDNQQLQSIDLFGINIESWCSSLQTFSKSEDGAVGTYWELFHDLINVTSVPIIFSEMGCSRELFNRDNGLQPQGARDWKQIGVVENEMEDLLSGFVAYTYDGSPEFRMTDGTQPWDGQHVLSLDRDMDNFLNQLNVIALSKSSLQNSSMVTEQGRQSSLPSLNCTSVTERLSSCCNLNLFLVDEISSYFVSSFVGNNETYVPPILGPKQYTQKTQLGRPSGRDGSSSSSRYAGRYEDQTSFNVVFGEQLVPVRFPRTLATASLVLAAFVLHVGRRPIRRQYISFAVENERRMQDYSTFP
jgi:Glucanosyltransferase